MIKWLYSEPGNPMWEWPGLQAVMFYSPDPPFSAGGPPPMTDGEWAELESASVARYRRFVKEWQEEGWGDQQTDYHAPAKNNTRRQRVS